MTNSKNTKRGLIGILVLALLLPPVFAENLKDSFSDNFIFEDYELVKNSSFEDVDSDGNTLFFKNNFEKNINDSKAAKHGSRYLQIEPGSVRGFYYTDTININKMNEPIDLSYWIKGSGTAYMCLSFLNNSSKIIGTCPVSNLTINNQEWTKINLKLKYQDLIKNIKFVKNINESDKIEKFSFYIMFKGSFCLDKISMIEESKTALIAKKAALLDSIKTIKAISIISANKIHKPVKIDGIIDKNEWNSSSGTTGFLESGKLNVSGSQMRVNIMYDAQKIYFSFYTIYNNISSDLKNPEWGHNVNAVEIWMQPPGNGWHQMLITSSGEIICNSEKGKTLKDKWIYKTKTEDSGETVGGVLSFAKTKWSTEAAVSFEDLGVKPPKDNEEWKINFNYDVAVEKGKKRTSKEWTTWSNLKKEFNDTDNYGTLVFRESSPGFKITNLGDLKNNIIDINGQFFPGKEPHINFFAWLSLNNSQETIVNSWYRELLPKKNDETTFGLSSAITLDKASDLYLNIISYCDNDTYPIARLKIPFTIKPGFNIETVPVYAENKLLILLDTKRLNTASNECILNISINSASTKKKISEKNFSRDKNNTNELLSMDMTGLDKGKYSVICKLTDKKANEIASASSEFEMPDMAQFPWFNNKIGISDDVPPPWSPVKYEKSNSGVYNIFITEREYTLGNNGFPKQIKALNEDLFISQSDIKLISNEKEIALKYDPISLYAKNKQSLRFRIHGSGSGFDVNGDLVIEYDGFALLKFDISQENAKNNIEALYIDFPMSKNKSQYARGENYFDEMGGDSFVAALFTENSNASEEIIGGKHYCNGQWLWNEILIHNLWVGGDESGLGLMTESDEYMSGNKRVEIIKGEKANIIRYNLISQKTSGNNKLHYEIAWQATPVKPRPDNPRMWHQDPASSDRTNAEFLKRGYVSMIAYWALDKLCYPSFHEGSRDKTVKDMTDAQKYGCNVTPYFSSTFVTTETAEWKYFGAEWAARPENGWNSIRGRGDYVSRNSRSFRDYWVWAVKETVDSLKFNGVYLDVSDPKGSLSRFQPGSGYEKNGKRYQTVDTWNLRKMYQRAYTMLKSDNRNGIIYRHHANSVADIGFMDVQMQGEAWCYEKNNRYDRLTPEFFRANEMMNQYGTPGTWYAFFHYYRGIAFGGYETPLNEILAYSLPHYYLPVSSIKGNWPIWDILDPYWATGKFIPYWNSENKISCNQKGVYASALALCDKKKCLLMIGNWNNEGRNIDIIVNTDAIAGIKNNARAKEMISGKELTIENSKISTLIQKKNILLIEIFSQ